MGRFLTEDPARDGANWYAYVGNNPLARIDPTGLWTVEEFNKAVLAASPQARKGLIANYSRLVDDTPGLERFNERMNSEFSLIERSMVGTPYAHDRAPSLSGSDCSGNVVYGLQEMGFRKVPSKARAVEMGTGQHDFVTVSEVDNAKQGEKGMLNFYNLTVDLENEIDHVNVGVGMQRRNENRNQIIDASSPDTSWEAGRNANQVRQLVPAQAGQTNQTWAPFSTRTEPVAQGRVNWLVLVEKYWGD